MIGFLQKLWDGQYNTLSNSHYFLKRKRAETKLATKFLYIMFDQRGYNLQTKAMGFLEDLGDILTPDQATILQPQLKLIAIRQFLQILKNNHKTSKKINATQTIKWGQQIEGHFLIDTDQNGLELCLAPPSTEYLEMGFPLANQYGRWMFEMIPPLPYQMKFDFQEIIQSIRQRYCILHSKPRIALTIPSIPLLGLINLKNQQQFTNEITGSLCVSDKYVADHVRYRALTENVLKRRGQKIEMFVPIQKDKNTCLQELSQTQMNPEFIHLDAMIFGPGMGCLQCTFSADNLYEARFLYDQMHIISPLMLAITAGTPFHKGKIGDYDARWKILEGSVDCRNQHERDPQSSQYLPTSRFSPASLYISNVQFNKPSYSNVKANLNPNIQRLIRHQAELLGIEIDDILVNHLVNLFKRDLLIVHQKFKTMTDDETKIFEMLNGNNYNSVRLKTPDGETGWRVQFRTMEVSLTPDENSAFSLLIFFFTRALKLCPNINLYLPLNLVLENFDIAHMNDAIRREKFYFRINIFDEGEPVIRMLTMHEIFFGYKKDRQEFLGLFPFLKKTLAKQCPSESMKRVEEVEEFIGSITSGRRLTLAQWMRKYVDKHPEYKHNSILPKKVIDDLLLRLYQISKGNIKDENYLSIFSL